MLTRKIKAGMISSLVLAAFVMTAIALYADLLIRLCILWFGLGIGVIASSSFEQLNILTFPLYRGKSQTIKGLASIQQYLMMLLRYHYKTHQCYQVLETS